MYTYVRISLSLYMRVSSTGPPSSLPSIVSRFLFLRLPHDGHCAFAFAYSSGTLHDCFMDCHCLLSLFAPFIIGFSCSRFFHTSFRCLPTSFVSSRCLELRSCHFVALAMIACFNAEPVCCVFYVLR